MLNFMKTLQGEMKGKIEFAFNDEVGTGNWHGETIFYVDSEGQFPTSYLADVQISFSTEWLP